MLNRAELCAWKFLRIGSSGNRIYPHRFISTLYGSGEVPNLVVGIRKCWRAGLTGETSVPCF